MLNRDQIAHEYMLKFLGREGSQLGFKDTFEVFTKDSFILADAMIAEAEKRTDKERPAILSDWISVEDRLPYDTQQVLIYVEKIGINSATYHEPHFGDAEKWLGWFSDEVPEPNVTHWQPLPNPPVQSGEK